MYRTAAFQGKISGDRTHRPRPPWNHISKRLQNTFPIPLDPTRDKDSSGGD
jgi:hypothetical protein